MAACFAHSAMPHQLYLYYRYYRPSGSVKNPDKGHHKYSKKSALCPQKQNGLSAEFESDQRTSPMCVCVQTHLQSLLDKATPSLPLPPFFHFL